MVAEAIDQQDFYRGLARRGTKHQTKRQKRRGPKKNPAHGREAHRSALAVRRSNLLGHAPADTFLTHDYKPPIDGYFLFGCAKSSFETILLHTP